MAEGKEADKHDVMISYNWEHQTTVLKIRDKLEENGFSCWIDKNNMSGSTLDAMSAAVENCTIFLMCYSKKYSESKNCKKEAEYAETRDKIIIPCKMEKDFVANGWLGILLGTKVYFEFSGKYPFDDKMEELLREIKNFLKPKTDEGGTGDLTKNIGDEGNSRIVKEISLRDAINLRHMVHVAPDKFWIGHQDKITLIDSKGKKLDEILRCRPGCGAHSVTKEGYLLYVTCVAVKRNLNNSVLENYFVVTNVDDWKAESVYASHRTGDIIVGLRKRRNGTIIGKIAVYDNVGTHKQTIEKDANEKPLYTWPRYVTENINGDIVTSDWFGGIVVTDQAGTHRFSYNLSIPRAVVTDSNGRIFGCNNTPKIHVLDQNGKFLMNILTGSKDVFSLYLHQDTELYAGYGSDEKIVVYKV